MCIALQVPTLIIHDRVGTGGLPKGRKSQGNGVFIVTAKRMYSIEGKQPNCVKSSYSTSTKGVGLLTDLNAINKMNPHRMNKGVIKVISDPTTLLLAYELCKKTLDRHQILKLSQIL